MKSPQEWKRSSKPEIKISSISEACFPLKDETMFYVNSG